MGYRDYRYDDEDEYHYDGYDDWYDQEDSGLQDEIHRPQPFDLLKLWFLGSLFFDLGDWDLFPDRD